MSYTLATHRGGGEIVEIIWRKRGETASSGGNMETFSRAMEKCRPTWRKHGGNMEIIVITSTR
jgi:hypothetical protein